MAADGDDTIGRCDLWRRLPDSAPASPSNVSSRLRNAAASAEDSAATGAQ